MSSVKQVRRPVIPAGPIVSLVYRVGQSQRADLISFLEAVKPFYEQPGGIKMGLYESIDEPGLFLELVAYDSEAQYDADQLRVQNDGEMKTVLENWHEFIEGPLEVRRLRPVPLNSGDRNASADPI